MWLNFIIKRHLGDFFQFVTLLWMHREWLLSHLRIIRNWNYRLDSGIDTTFTSWDEYLNELLLGNNAFRVHCCRLYFSLHLELKLRLILNYLHQVDHKEIFKKALKVTQKKFKFFEILSWALKGFISNRLISVDQKKIGRGTLKKQLKIDPGVTLGFE